MYLTAHWVRTHDATPHLNAVLYEHQGTSVPPDLWARAHDEIIELVTTTHPGKRVAQRFETTPGGNSVECFLDVIGPDGTPLDAVAHVVDVLAEKLRSEGAPRERVASNGVIAEFSVVLGEPTPIRRFEELRHAALELYRDRQPPWHGEPLTIEQTREKEGLRFRLDDAAAARLATRAPDAARERRTVRIPFDVKDAFEEMHGSLYAHVGEWLTGLPREELIHSGGVRFVEGESELAVWPSRERG